MPHKAAKDSPRRLDAAKKLLADMGGEMKQFYMVMGEFDFVGIWEARTTPSWRVTCWIPTPAMAIGSNPLSSTIQS
jgi:hypothetical protein